MERNPVGWFEIYVQDMERAKEFYRAVLDVELSRIESNGLELWCFPMEQGKPGCAGALVKMDGVESGGNSVLVYFSCADCSVEAARVAGAGGYVHKEKFSIGAYGYIALVFDTEGNMFGLHSME